QHRHHGARGGDLRAVRAAAARHRAECGDPVLHDRLGRLHHPGEEASPDRRGVAAQLHGRGALLLAGHAARHRGERGRRSVFDGRHHVVPHHAREPARRHPQSDPRWPRPDLHAGRAHDRGREAVDGLEHQFRGRHGHRCHGAVRLRERFSAPGLSGGSGQAGGLLQQEGHRERALAHGGLGPLARPFWALSDAKLSSSLPGLTDLRRITLRNSGKPELRCNPSTFVKRPCWEKDGCAGHKRVYARLRRASAPRMTGGKSGSMLLTGILIIDATGRLGWVAGRVLADLGADVVKLEPPGSDRGGADYWAFNVNKRILELDLQAPSDRARLEDLLRAADVCLLTPSDSAAHLDPQALRENYPRLVVVAIRPFGGVGPRSAWRASDIELMAAGGAMALAGEPDGMPVRVSEPQSYGWAGAQAAIGALVALFHRDATGRGDLVDVSAQASVVTALSHAPAFVDLVGLEPTRAGAFITGRSIKGARYRVFWPCRDGYINFIFYGGVAGRRTNEQLVAWMR